MPIGEFELIERHFKELDGRFFRAIADSMDENVRVGRQPLTRVHHFQRNR